MTRYMFNKISKMIEDGGCNIQDSFFYPDGDGVEGFNASFYLFNYELPKKLKDKLNALKGIEVIIRKTDKRFTCPGCPQTINIFLKEVKQ